ncbi:MAG: amidohydrolase family protein [Parachlamydiales bacterium]|jgi:2,3-dihydroxybenzoate decarboxylase
MKKIALEEHFVNDDFLPYTSKADFKVMDAKDVEDFKTRLLDIGEIRIQEMDKAGIDIAVLSLTDPGLQGELDTPTALKLAPKVNDYLAEKIAANPKRFRGFAQLPMQDPKAAVKELERCIRELKFVGVLVNGQTQDRYLDEEIYHPFWEKIQELDVPVYIHPGSPLISPHSYKDRPELNGAFWGWMVETATHALRLIVSGTFDRFPAAKIILGHMGETLPFLIWRFDSRWKILKHDKPLKKLPSQYIRENIYITTSGVCSNNSLICSINEMGENNVMFSVDYPYESSEIAAQFIEKATISESVREKVAYKNAARLLKITE